MAVIDIFEQLKRKGDQLDVLTYVLMEKSQKTKFGIGWAYNRELIFNWPFLMYRGLK